MKDSNFVSKQEARAMKLTKRNGKGHQINHSSHTKTKDVSTVPVITNLVTAPQGSNTSQFLNTSPPHTSHTQQHSQQRQSTVGIATPTLPVTNPQFPHNLKHPPPPSVPQVNQQLNYQVRPPHFQQFTQSQVSPLQMPPQPFNPQILPPYFPQYPPSDSPSVDSNDSSILAALQKQWEKQERLDKEHFDMERQKEERKRLEK